MNQTNVTFVRKELSEKLPYYNLIEDCLRGEAAVKAAATKYLPVPNPDVNTENSQRYKDYVTRAVFYNVTARTLSGITGLVYLKDVNYKLPPLLEPLRIDCTGEGISLPQLSKRALRWGLSFGRAGLFVDYPELEMPATAEDIASGKIQPIFRLYKADQIVNWRTKTVNGKVVLSLVVLKEFYDDETNEFAMIQKTRYRILRLTDAGYTVEVVEGKGLVSNGTTTPVDSDGKPFDDIPFFFIGSENNDSVIDHPPIYDLAVINIAHYRNSADYEEAVYTVGQPTVWAAGLTEEWANNILDNEIVIGSRGLLKLPEGGNAGILQVTGNTMCKEAMDQKESQMLALGAKLVQVSSGNRTTATEAAINDASETSILVNVSKNVSDAFTAGLLRACKYVGADYTDVEFFLQADLDATKMDSQDLMALVGSWQDGAISRTELRYNLRKNGLIHGDEAAALAEIEKGRPANQQPNEKGVENGVKA